MMMNSSSQKRRRKPNERLREPRSMRETERDREIVRLVYDYRILSQQQIAQLVGKSRSTVQQSLVRLYDHQYLDRVFLPVSTLGSSPTLYILDKRGIEMLQRYGVASFTGVPSKDISPFFKEHTLAINQFRIAITLASKRLGWEIAEWRTENELKADYDRVNVRTGIVGKAQHIPIVPDSYFVVRIPGRGISHFCLELDRGTMTLERFKMKMIGYVAYHKSGGYEKRFNAQSLRVLTVVDTPTPKRMVNLVALTGQVEGIGRRFWFAHLPNVTPTTALLEPIWLVAGSERSEALFKAGK